MKLLPDDILNKLEFDKVLLLLEEKCMGQPGKEYVLGIRPRTEWVILERMLKEVSEFKMSIVEDCQQVPMGNYENIAKELKMLAIPGSVLGIEEILKLRKLLWVVDDLFKFFNPENQKIFPTIFDIIRPLSFDEKLIVDIGKIVDDEGRIKRSASPELSRIHKQTLSRQRDLDKEFKDTIKSYRNKGWLSDNIESFRNGRRVLSVPAEHKRKIQGIIHDESSTGRTSFIEPQEIIDINNDLFNLENEERREVYRILKALCERMRAYVPMFHKYREVLVRLDVVQAKAKLAVEMEAVMPKYKGKPTFGFRESYHPLLKLKNQEEKKKTVPFDLILHNDNRTLVLSGPNAGGKSISMKGAGLLQLMFQAGMLVPCDPETEFGIFESIFADIGDQQSIEDDLSTYSSRLKNMKSFLQNADKNTLVLIDEFGSGTDPKVGGAIAEAILKELHQKEVFCFITTHYSNLKVFAFKTPGIVNGAMRFDKDTLSPTYELLVGKPGSSYGFEIAHKIGLHKSVLKYAKHKVGKNDRAVDQLLIDLQREKQELEEKLQRAESKQEHLDKLVKTYEQMYSELEVGRKRLKLEAKELEMQRSAQDNKVLEKLVREIKEEKNLEKAKKMAAEARQSRKTNSESVQGLREDIYHNERKKIDRPIRVGDFVKLKSGGTTGKVVRITKNKIEMEMGLLTFAAHLRDVELVGEPLEIQRNKGIKSDMVTRAAEMSTKLDIRGMRWDEAVLMLEKFTDEALISGVNRMEIIHGKGSGALRKAVREKLREYKQVKMKFSHPAREMGGDGVTFIDIE
ncbi:MAG: endonuclease MutS2, partial [Saprospiraceae bacterium]